MKKVLVLGLMVLASCATTRGYKRKLNKYIGIHKNVLLKTWGYPVYIRKWDKNTKVFVYDKKSSSTYSNTIKDFYDPNNSYTTTDTITKHCQTLFYIDRSNRVFDYSFTGNGCKSL